MNTAGGLALHWLSEMPSIGHGGMDESDLMQSEGISKNRAGKFGTGQNNIIVIFSI